MTIEWFVWWHHAKVVLPLQWAMQLFLMTIEWLWWHHAKVMNWIMNHTELSNAIILITIDSYVWWHHAKVVWPLQWGQ